MGTMKYAARALLRSLGFDVRRYSIASSQDAQFAAMLSQSGADLVFDVGANCGQFGHELRSRFGYQGRIVSFEPMRAAHQQLLAAARGDKCWDVAPRMAIGAASGSVTLNVSGNSVSSSILPMLDTHSQAAPESRYVGQEIVPASSLDEVATRYVTESSRVFVKIDTQGYEDPVLQGAQRTLAHAVGVQLELSFVPLYEGQLLIKEMWQKLEELGFELWFMAPAFVDPATGRWLQVDATFFRR